jgi:hypothetical protein
MLARVTTFEGGTADGIRAAVEPLQSDIPSGPPPGVKSNGLTPEGAGTRSSVDVYQVGADVRM